MRNNVNSNGDAGNEAIEGNESAGCAAPKCQGSKLCTERDIFTRLRIYSTATYSVIVFLAIPHNKCFVLRNANS